MRVITGGFVKRAHILYTSWSVKCSLIDLTIYTGSWVSADH